MSTVLDIPATQSQVSVETLRQNADAMMSESNSWTQKLQKDGMTIWIKRDIFPGLTSLKYTTDFQADIEKIEAVMYRQMLDRMPDWSAEYIEGQVLEGSLMEGDGAVLRTAFKTPFFMSNREYVFQFNRHEYDDRRYYFYHSVDYSNAPDIAKGFVRATLLNTVYRFQPLDDGKIRMTHILTTDLGGKMPAWFQNSGAVANGMVKANARDCRNLVRLMS